MWATKEMTGKDDREIFIRTTLRELIIYMIFLIVFCCCKSQKQKRFSLNILPQNFYFYSNIWNDFYN